MAISSVAQNYPDPRAELEGANQRQVILLVTGEKSLIGPGRIVEDTTHGVCVSHDLQLAVGQTVELLSPSEEIITKVVGTRQRRGFLTKLQVVERRTYS